MVNSTAKSRKADAIELIRAFAPRGLSRNEAAAYLGIGPTLFDKLVAEGKLPKSIPLHGRRIWDRKRIDAAMDRMSDDCDPVEANHNEWDTSP